MNQTIDISANQRSELLALIKHFLPRVEIWAFGSRVKWTARSNSDLDLVAFTKPKEQTRVSQLKEALEESSLPFKVDLLVWDTIPESFKKNIQEAYVILIEGKKNPEPLQAAHSNDGHGGLHPPYLASFQTKRIGEVCSVGDGAHSKVERLSEGIPYLTSKNIGQGNLKLDQFDCISEEAFEKLFPAHSKATRRPQAGDVLFGIIGTFGNAYLYKASDKFGFSSSIGILRPNPHELHPKFLYYVLSSQTFKDNHANHNAGSVQGYTNIATVKSLEIPVPPFDDQIAIARILSSLDDKIELNRQTNQTLEQIAQALFKSWFVDFEPTRAKIAAKKAGASPEEIERAAMCAISGKTPDQLAQLAPETQQNLKTTAARFPDALVDSELGEVPEGWEVKSLSDIAQYANGKIEVSKLNVSNYISTENMLENRGGITAATSLPSVPTVPSFSSNHILISNIRPYFKKIWLARFDGGRSNDVLGFVAKEKGCEEFLYNLLYQDEFFEFMMRTSKGAKMPRGDKDAIAGWKFVCASKALRLHFSEIIRPSYSIIESLNSESISLSNARDNLLPKLLSGEIQFQNNEETINV